MKIKEFAEKVRTGINSFEQYWIEGREQSPEHYPEEFEQEEWEQQFTAWFEANMAPPTE